MEDMNFADHDPRWQAFERTHTSQLPASSLGTPRLDYDFGTVANAPTAAGEYKGAPYEPLAEDCISPPVSLDGNIELPFLGPLPLPWPASYAPDLELMSASPESTTEDAVKGMRKERRRAQNRKAQKAFRERKDKAIQRLEEEVEKLQKVNDSLSTANDGRLREITELRVELERLCSLSPSSVENSCFERRDSFHTSRRSLSTSKSSTSATTARMSASPNEPTDICGPFIQWRGKVYVDAESLLKPSSKEYG